eukprot:2466194-Pyramimonas_sp.AAC.1
MVTLTSLSNWTTRAHTLASTVERKKQHARSCSRPSRPPLLGLDPLSASLTRCLKRNWWSSTFSTVNSNLIFKYISTRRSQAPRHQLTTWAYSAGVKRIPASEGSPAGIQSLREGLYSAVYSASQCVAVH